MTASRSSWASISCSWGMLLGALGTASHPRRGRGSCSGLRLAAEGGVMTIDDSNVGEEPDDYDPEWDDFEDEVDTPEDYEGDRYSGLVQ